MLSCKNNCTGIAVVASIIIGIITAFFRITAVITVSSAFLWIVFGVAIVYLALTLAATAVADDNRLGNCVYTTLSTLLISILGTILLSVVLLAITFAATSVVGAVLTGLLLFFFSLMVSSVACLVKCFARCN